MWGFPVNSKIFAGYKGSKNPVRNRLKIQSVKIDFSNLIFQNQVQMDRALGGLLPVIVAAILISLTSQQRPIKLNCPLDLGVFLDVFQDKFKGTWDFRKIKDV